MKSAYASILALSLPVFSCLAAELPEKVDGELGRKLVKAASGSLADDYSHTSENGFRMYRILGKGDCCGSTWYAVNIWTGDVWDVSECKRMSNTTLLEDQADIRRSFTKEELPQYKNLKNLRPVDLNLDPC